MRVMPAPTANRPGTPLLEVQRLSIGFPSPRGVVRAVSDASLALYPGRILAVLGESGSGKSTLAKSILRLLPNGTVPEGGIRLLESDIFALEDAELQELRGGRIAMVFQDALNALDPCFTVGRQMEEVLQRHRPQLDRKALRRRIEELLVDVGLPGASRVLSSYPHELSGGMRQRVVIAMALSCEPVVILADEPTTALDVTIQAQILALFRKLRDVHHTSIILVTHDVGVAASIADDVAVMYAGRVVEFGTAREVLKTPSHPYTAGLLGSIPSREKRGTRLEAIGGAPVQQVGDLTPGCAFGPRCAHATELCATSTPETRPVAAAGGHAAACHYAPQWAAPSA